MKGVRVKLDESLSNSEKRTMRLKIARSKGTHTDAAWQRLKVEFGGRCVICWRVSKLQKDHIVPIYVGGSDSIRNIQPLCRSCNCAKSWSETDYKKLRRAQKRGAYREPKTDHC